MPTLVEKYHYTRKVREWLWKHPYATPLQVQEEFHINYNTIKVIVSKFREDFDNLMDKKYLIYLHDFMVAKTKREFALSMDEKTILNDIELHVRELRIKLQKEDISLEIQKNYCFIVEKKQEPVATKRLVI